MADQKTLINTESEQEKSLLQEDVEQQLEDAANNPEAQEQSPIVFHNWSTETVTVSTLLKRYKDRKFILPLCQRLYIWNERQRMSLFESVRRNLPCGTIILAEIDGVKYLVDGLQRTTSLLLLTNSKKLSDNEKQVVRDYKISVVTVLDMDLQSMKNYFAVLNSGVVLAATVKERSKLPEDLNNAILTIANSADGFFRTIETNATFSKSHHHEIIAMNALLAVSEIELGEMKARKLCALLKDNKDTVMLNIEQAQQVIIRISNIYNGIDTDTAKNSLNSNFLGVLVYVMINNPNIADEQIKVLINYIFAGKRSVKEYSATTSQGGSDAAKCKTRYELLVNLLDNPDKMGFNEGGFKEFERKYKDIDIKDSTGKKVFTYKMLSEDEAKALYLAKRNCNQKEWDKILVNKSSSIE